MLIVTLVMIIFYLIMVSVSIFYFFNESDSTCLKCCRGILPIIIWLLFMICEILAIVANGENKDNIEYLNGLASLQGCINDEFVY